MTALASAIKAINDYTANGDERSQMVAAQCRALMHGYDAKYWSDDFVTEVVEETLVAPLINPVTGAKSRRFNMAGKLDVIIRRKSNGRRVLMDHKSTSQSVEFSSPYWQQLRIDGQSSQYLILSMQKGIEIDECVWDVIRKASIRQTQKESLADFEARLTKDCTEERPEWYFARKLVTRLDEELLDYASECWDHGQQIMADTLAYEKTGKMPPKSAGACMAYNTPCKFIELCAGCDTLESGNWNKKPSVHAELPSLPDDGKGHLTHSRMRSLQTCRRKHLLDYVVGVEKAKDRDSDALYFGTVLHVGLEKWFEFFKE